MSALLHREFKMMLMDLAVFGETERERQLAGLTHDIYNAAADDPKVMQVINDFTRRALDEHRHH